VIGRRKPKKLIEKLILVALEIKSPGTEPKVQWGETRA
jgi:hypothetical protein